jgi:hypothetical protein
MALPVYLPRLVGSVLVTLLCCVAGWMFYEVFGGAADARAIRKANQALKNHRER